MVNLLFLIIVIVVVGLLGWFLYLVYVPFKKRLQASGELTNKLNRQINGVYFLSLCSVCVVIYCFKDYRTPSKVRLEKIADVKIPKGFNVLNDEYQDMVQDYYILYTIQFENRAMAEFIKSIQAAKFYNANVNPQSMPLDSLFIKIDNTKAIWCKSEKGYRFMRNDGLTSYAIELDTVTNILNYTECAD